jgi:hypothetical protein
VVFQGERLPDGTPADAISLVLSAPSASDEPA